MPLTLYRSPQWEYHSIQDYRALHFQGVKDSQSDLNALSYLHSRSTPGLICSYHPSQNFPRPTRILGLPY